MPSGSDPTRTSAISARGTEVVVREWGDEDARPLVFWHGLNPFGALQLNEAGPAWAERGFRVVAPAAPGMGESPAFANLEDYRPTRLAELVVELADALGLARFDFVGWSWGATIGVHLAARHGRRLTALVLLDAGHTDVQDAGQWNDVGLEDRLVQWEAGLQTFVGWEEFIALAKERASAWRPALEERLLFGMEARDGLIVPKGAVAAAAASFHWVGVEPPSARLPLLGRLELPIMLVVATRNDTAAQVERFRAAVAHATIATVDSEHDLLAHAPEATIALVADWIVSRS